MKNFTVLEKPNLGLLIIRIVLGITFIIFGVKKFIGGTAVLEGLGSSVKVFGITAFPYAFGFLAALGEALGGLLILIGYQFRFAAFLLFLIMFVAFAAYFESLDSCLKNAWSLQLMAVFLGLVFTGPGIYSLDKRNRS